MYEIRFHGRGGQGAWTTSQLLAKAAMSEGKHAQSFPEFGPERMGAPIQSFTRISDDPIDLHCNVDSPDVVAVLDPTLLETVDVAEGLRPEGVVLINSRDPPAKIKETYHIAQSVYTVGATDIAMDILKRDVTSTAILGALMRVSPLVSLKSVIRVTKERFHGKAGELNEKVIRSAYEGVVS